MKNTGASTARASTRRLIWDRTTLAVDRSLIPDILRLLRDEEQFDYCVDITAVHYPKREKQFDVVWILYSFPRNERVRVKTQIADGASIPSSVSIWPTANWLEREVYDMFGIQFDGHPDLKRILLPTAGKAIRCARITAFCSKTKNGCRSTSESRADNERAHERQHERRLEPRAFQC